MWLFQEVNNKPKQQVVDSVVAGFEKAHEGAEVTVEYIPVETRAQRIKAAFNDPSSAPDLIEYGNTDTAGYVKDGGLADVTEEFGAWDEAKDTDPTARQSVTVDGKVYGAPYFVGVRALYYRTDVFADLGLEPPADQAALISTAKKIRAERPELYGIAVGGAYTYGAMPFLWAHGGELATGKGGSYAAAVDSPEARKGVEAYTSLFGDDNCPAAKCAGMGGNDTVTAFASGKAAMAIGADFSHAAIEAGKVKGRSVIWDFKVFTQIYVMTNGGGIAGQNLVLNVYVYQQAFASSQYSLGAAIGVVMLLILLAVTLVYLRLLRRRGEEL